MKGGRGGGGGKQLKTKGIGQNTFKTAHAKTNSSLIIFNLKIMTRSLFNFLFYEVLTFSTLKHFKKQRQRVRKKEWEGKGRK